MLASVASSESKKVPASLRQASHHCLVTIGSVVSRPLRWSRRSILKRYSCAVSSQACHSGANAPRTSTVAGFLSQKYFFFPAGATGGPRFVAPGLAGRGARAPAGAEKQRE